MTADDQQMTQLQADSSEPLPPGSSPLTPVSATDRLTPVDILRGVAVLGILVINMPAYAQPMASFHSPNAAGELAGISLLLWQISQGLFMQKFLAVFSMLFGAGLILMYQRAEERGVHFGKIYYRRLLWLLFIGMLHAYFIWFGDILTAYALCGLVLYPLRRVSAKVLLVVGILVYLVGVPLQIGGGLALNYIKDAAADAEAARAAGETLSDMDKEMLEAWNRTQAWINPGEEQIQAEIDLYRDGYAGILQNRAPIALMIQTQVFLGMVLWRACGLMLLGMALMKWGVLAGRRSLRFYVLFALVGYIIGLPLVFTGIREMMAHNFDALAKLGRDGLFNYVGSVFVALGHVGLVMVLVKLGVAGWLQRRLAAVGRIALTNYLLQSIICTFIFYGYGLALFGQVSRATLMALVVAIWLVQLIVSPIWVRHFRFGPAEWLWRTLTYLKRQPFRSPA